ncbi:chemotaxis-specific protein-glutamate methyltransferase CheB [Mariprofundus erugo]|uniref:Protein-glutamate methylesterase/protein-glutamine glutaminase n=1 Tax=Mariprofundus erugo TaxID=2528639 RepID=A0A5R9GNC7_9PROT|nr:chemotaxis-specific protein-glutamate methyltransferase CheB [Mariprofundus erugo]TLS67520.1 chemotaxis-specific protein-glutamate methyltransferase CheB [Mariprofundus erugo]
MIRVLLVDDSPIALLTISRILETAPDITVVGRAANGQEALDLIPALQPDVICTDLHMPVMDGLRFTEAVMQRFPRPILVISISVFDSKSDNVFNLLQAGAVDVFAKPRSGLRTADEPVARALIQKIRAISGVVAFTRRSHGAARVSPPPPRPATVELPPVAGSFDVLVIGASTGGPLAYEAILSALPASFPLPVICVQHISEGFLPGMVSWLDSCSKLKVKQASHLESLKAGFVYFAPEGKHLTVNANRLLQFSPHSEGDLYCPAVDVLFHSVANHFGAKAIALLLTGMGDDGARGLKRIREENGMTIAQDESSCVVYGMPHKAVEMNAARMVLPLALMADKVVTLVTGAGRK